MLNSYRAVLVTAAACLILVCLLPFSSANAADFSVNHSDADRSPALESPIGWYQKFISRADGNRCPMYPSCSHYAAQAFASKGLFKGLLLTCDRLLRCGRDETRLAEPVSVQGIRHTYDPLIANTFWWEKN